MKHRKQSRDLAVISMFFATMLVIHFLTSIVFNLLPVPIKPTLLHIPVIVASIIYGPKIGAILGALMGLISIITNTVVLLPTSYLFSPFVPEGNINSVLIAMLPRILTGISPYLIYKFFKNKLGLILAGAIGSATNTIFVLGGIFFLFADVYQGDVKAMLAIVLGANSQAELLISVLLTLAVVPPLMKLKNNK